MDEEIPGLPATLDGWLYQFQTAFKAVPKVQPVNRVPKLTVEEMQLSDMTQERG